MFICQETAQSSGYSMSHKFRRVNFPKGTHLCVSLLCGIIVPKMSLLQYLTPQKIIRNRCQSITFNKSFRTFCIIITARNRPGSILSKANTPFYQVFSCPDVLLMSFIGCH